MRSKRSRRSVNDGWTRTGTAYGTAAPRYVTSSSGVHLALPSAGGERSRASSAYARSCEGAALEVEGAQAESASARRRVDVFLTLRSLAPPCRSASASIGGTRFAKSRCMKKLLIVPVLVLAAVACTEDD